MWNLNTPDISATRAHLNAIFPDTDIPVVLTPAQKDLLKTFYEEYEQAAGRPNTAWKDGRLTDAAKDAILTAYGEVTETGKLSGLRAMLMLSATVCPYCGFGEIRDLDHHLQKAHYKCFSIFPLNLVPSCSKCNGHKPRIPRTNPEEQQIHAYLEDLSGHRFLVADVVLTESAVLAEFRIKKRKGMSKELFARLEQHLKDFRLSKRYPAQVNIFLGTQQVGLEMSYELGGAKGVCSFLKRTTQAMDSSFGPNDWRGALCSALAQCRPFCNGGFYQALGFAPPPPQEHDVG
ncbi:HNH endonuclease [Pseudomonas cichorii]|nr:HNH endonuclease [Pseudomonas cichorii]MBX8563803.1 HNH endonuclease [Pseudomonas cichorii]